MYDRFSVVHTESQWQGSKGIDITIIRDNYTGINYLMSGTYDYDISHGGGLTPLLDKNGNIIRT